MAWSYTADPTNRPIDAVRFLIGDTDSTDQLIQDQEIQWFLLNEPVIRAAARAAEAIAAKFSRKADKRVGDLWLELSQRAKQYRELAGELWEQAGGKSPNLALAPYAGGISRADKDSVEEDSDRVRPAFKRDTGFFDKTDDDDLRKDN